MSPKPGSPEDPLSPPVSASDLPAPSLLPAEGAPAESLPDAPPAAGLAPPLAPPELELLGPELPEELELLDPELPLLELGELDPLLPPELGDEAPELEGEDGGVGIEGVVGVLAEGHPINVSITAIKPPAATVRSSGNTWMREREYRVIRVVAPSLQRLRGLDQKTTQSYQCPRRRPLRIEA